ncbi:MAG: DUF1559 domain-containing protein [Planctomycetia bacterium]
MLSTVSDRGRKRSGFTLVELLVVIAIIGILIALLLPAIQAAREAARKLHCTNNLKQVGLALHSYASMHNSLPFGSDYGDHDAGERMSWIIAILPFMEQQNVYDQIDFSVRLADSPNKELAEKTVIQGLICPSDPSSSNPILTGRGDSPWDNVETSAMLSYTACAGPTHFDACHYCDHATPSPSNYCCQGYHLGTVHAPSEPSLQAFAGIFGRSRAAIRFRDVTDGLTQTIMAGETIPSHQIWNGVFVINFPLAPTNIPINKMVSDDGQHGGHVVKKWASTSGYKSYHPGGAHLMMGDGSVHFVPDTIDYRLYNDLGTRAGGELVRTDNGSSNIFD